MADQDQHSKNQSQDDQNTDGQSSDDPRPDTDLGKRTPFGGKLRSDASGWVISSLIAIPHRIASIAAQIKNAVISTVPGVKKKDPQALLFDDPEKTLEDDPRVKKIFDNLKDGEPVSNADMKKILALLLKEVDQNETIERQAFKKINMLVRGGFIYLPVVFIGLALGNWMVEQYAERKGLDHMLDEFSIVQSTEEGRVIYAGQGPTPYIGYSNNLAKNLASQHQWNGYGFKTPTDGSLDNILTLSFNGQCQALAFAQKDAALYAEQTLGLDHFVILRELDTAPEVVVTISENFNSYADFEAAVAAAAATETLEDTVRVGLPSEYTGSYVTTQSLTAPLDEQGYEYVSFDTSAEMIAAVKSGNVDVACFVQFSGPVDHELVGPLKTIHSDGVQIMEMDEQSFRSHFQNSAAGYRHIDVTIPIDARLTRLSSWDNALPFNDIDLPPLLGVNPVIIARNPDMADNEHVKNIARKLHRAVQSLSESDVTPDVLPDITEVTPASTDQARRPLHVSQHPAFAAPRPQS